jgi:hypothetical protein
MKSPPALDFQYLTIDELTIDDEDSFKHVGLYEDLKEVLRRAKYPFRVLPEGASARWDRALLLNLTYWGASEGGDVLVDRHLAADVVAHAAWHHLSVKAFPAPSPGSGAPLSADSLFFGEAIASAFDVYLVGRLLGHSPKSTFLESQVPAMADAAEAAGLPERDAEKLFASIAKDPDRAFEDLRELLTDATTSLAAAAGPREALGALAQFDAHRFGPLLHRYELSNWVLYARAYAGKELAADERVRALDAKLRGAASALDTLVAEWVTPALA